MPVYCTFAKSAQISRMGISGSSRLSGEKTHRRRSRPSKLHEVRGGNRQKRW